MIIMANKRSLKHAINLICEELFAEAVAASLYGNNPKAGNADDVLTSIIRLQTDYISRISHVEPGMEARKYFRVLRDAFTKEADEIIVSSSTNLCLRAKSVDGAPAGMKKPEMFEALRKMVYDEYFAQTAADKMEA